MAETWKPVVGYEGLYEVSDLGRVKSLQRVVPHRTCGGAKTVHERILKQMITPLDYRYVVLAKNGVNKHMLVHRLVAMAFIPNPLNLPIVNHKDETPSNNTLSNLEWCTEKYNSNYGNAIAKKRKSQKSRDWSFRKYTGCNRKKVVQINASGEVVAVFDSLTDAAQKTNTPLSKISSCCHGNRKTSNGYEWRFSNG